MKKSKNPRETGSAQERACAPPDSRGPAEDEAGRRALELAELARGEMHKAESPLKARLRRAIREVRERIGRETGATSRRRKRR
jgi:hypothetical protein